jgi:hypothetical protein
MCECGAATRDRGYGGVMRRLARRINPLTLFLWVLAAGMAALMIAEYVTQRV